MISTNKTLNESETITRLIVSNATKILEMQQTMLGVNLTGWSKDVQSEYYDS